MTFKMLFRCFYAFVLILITTMLIWTCVVKTLELTRSSNTPDHVSTFSSNTQTEYRLLSNNQKPDKKLWIVIKNQGYIAELNCEHYLKTLCTDQDNQHPFRRIDHVTVQRFNDKYYIQEMSYTNTQNMQQNTVKFSAQDIRSFHQADLITLRNQIITLSLFALFALYVCYRILRDFRKFLNK